MIMIHIVTVMVFSMLTLVLVVDVLFPIASPAGRQEFVLQGQRQFNASVRHDRGFVTV